MPETFLPTTEATRIEMVNEEWTIGDVVSRLDTIGQQMNWLCENMASLFSFVAQMSNGPGGIRGIMQALKQSPPQIKESLDE